MEGVGADDPEAVDMRDNIAHKMWVDYLRYLEDEERSFIHTICDWIIIIPIYCVRGLCPMFHIINEFG